MSNKAGGGIVHTFLDYLEGVRERKRAEQRLVELRADPEELAALDRECREEEQRKKEAKAQGKRTDLTSADSAEVPSEVHVDNDGSEEDSDFPEGYEEAEEEEQDDIVIDSGHASEDGEEPSSECRAIVPVGGEDD
jgi:hypothetical protein